MGLAEAYGIVKQSGGYILVASEVGEGTRVRVLLPAFTRSATVATREPRATVILVHDDEGLSGLASDLSLDPTYRIHEARSIAEAFLHCELCGGRVTVLAIDVSFLGAPAPELAARMRAVCRNLQVLFLRFDGASVESDSASESSLAAPLTADSLGRALQASIARAEAVRTEEPA